MVDSDKSVTIRTGRQLVFEIRNIFLPGVTGAGAIDQAQAVFRRTGLNKKFPVQLIQLSPSVVKNAGVGIKTRRNIAADAPVAVG